MRNILFVCVLMGIIGCSGDNSANSCSVLAGAGGNLNSNPAYQWGETKCACSQPPHAGAPTGASCNSPNDCAGTCCTCPNGNPTTFDASACMNHSCLDSTATCQAVLAATSDPCK